MPFNKLPFIYLRGAYEKRVEDLEKFAQDKNFWAGASGPEEDINYVSKIFATILQCLPIETTHNFSQTQRV